SRSFIKLAMCRHFDAVDISPHRQNPANKPLRCGLPAPRAPARQIPPPPMLSGGRGGARENAPRRLGVLRSDVNRSQPDRGGEDGGIVGEADERQHVRNEVKRQHKVRERTDEGDLNPGRRVAIERAEIGCSQILGKRQPRSESLDFRPEFAAQASLLAPQRGVVFYIDPVGSERLPDHPRPSGAGADPDRAPKRGKLLGRKQDWGAAVIYLSGIIINSATMDCPEAWIEAAATVTEGGLLPQSGAR